MPAQKELRFIYERLISHFGPQNWWPADSPFEVMVGAVLTQNTSWRNVEKAVDNLKQARALNLSRMYRMPLGKLASLIRPAGYYNLKAQRLRNFLKFLVVSYRGNLRRMGREGTAALRAKLLGVKGIGPETADSILLYALNKPVFVVDAYTKRIFARHKLVREEADYEGVRNFITQTPKIARES